MQHPHKWNAQSDRQIMCSYRSYTDRSVPRGRQTQILYTHTHQHTCCYSECTKREHTCTSSVKTHGTFSGAWWGHMAYTNPEAVHSYWVTVILKRRTKWSQLKRRGGYFCLLPSFRPLSDPPQPNDICSSFSSAVSLPHSLASSLPTGLVC